MCIFCTSIFLSEIKKYEADIEWSKNRRSSLLQDLEQSKQELNIQIELASRYIDQSDACDLVPILFDKSIKLRRDAYNLQAETGQISHFRYTAEIIILDHLIQSIKDINNKTKRFAQQPDVQNLNTISEEQ